MLNHKLEELNLKLPDTLRSIFTLLLLSPLNGFSQETLQIEETKGLHVGFFLEIFTTMDQHEGVFGLADALQKDSFVLIFYGGQ